MDGNRPSKVAGGGGGRWGGPTEGKTEKGGFTHLSMVRGDNTVVAVIKGGKGAVKTADGWQSAEEPANDRDRQNPARFAARMLTNYKTPAVQAADLADQVKELKKQRQPVRRTDRGRCAVPALVGRT